MRFFLPKDMSDLDCRRVISLVYQITGLVFLAAGIVLLADAGSSTLIAEAVGLRPSRIGSGVAAAISIIFALGTMGGGVALLGRGVRIQGE